MSVSIQSTAIVGACTQIYSQSVKLTDILVMASTTALSRQNSHCLQHSEESETHFSQHCGYKFIRYAFISFLRAYQSNRPLQKRERLFARKPKPNNSAVSMLSALNKSNQRL